MVSSLFPPSRSTNKWRFQPRKGADGRAVERGWQFGERDETCNVPRVVCGGGRRRGRRRGDEEKLEEEEDEEAEEAEEGTVERGENSPRGREPSGSGFSMETSGMDKLRSDCPRGWCIIQESSPARILPIWRRWKYDRICVGYRPEWGSLSPRRAHPVNLTPSRPPDRPADRRQPPILPCVIASRPIRGCTHDRLSNSVRRFHAVSAIDGVKSSVTPRGVQRTPRITSAETRWDNLWRTIVILLDAHARLYLATRASNDAARCAKIDLKTTDRSVNLEIFLTPHFAKREFFLLLWRATHRWLPRHGESTFDVICFPLRD